MCDVRIVRVWFTDHDLSPNGDVWDHNLDVVKLIVPLPYRCGDKKLADLAVVKDGVESVRRQYEAVTFQQLRSRDPMVSLRSQNTILDARG
ncbi:hypothetical protein KXX35_008391 [Aspergillus fumigatus]|nr:hypothetical protein KXX35_008391 [Aspergillus fumigatus]KAH2671603.1 hypothetical protein KXV51_006147 [Aspergillus fumigatus]KMK58531.1 hypothetical protein Y699_07758 [Aspergillus fumigatus Z5]